MEFRTPAWIFASSLLVAFAAELGADEVPFAERADLPGLQATGQEAIADIDGDGDLDLFAASDGSGGDSVRWYEHVDGSAPPEFVAHTVLTFGGNELASRLVAVDLDRDGDLDTAILADDTDDDTVTVFWVENDGTPANGGWTRHDVVSWDPPLLGSLYSSYCGGLASGDFDGDGDPDLTVSYVENEALEVDGDGRVVWLRSDGTPANGGWMTEPLVDWTTDRAYCELVPADLDSDGDLDLVLARYDNDAEDADNVQWAENDGTPGVGFWLRRLLADITGSLNAPAVADFDRDGDLDVAVADGHYLFNPTELRWLESDGAPGDGGWITRTVAAPGYYRYIVPADVDRDGDVDLVSYESWFENDGTPTNGAWTERGVSGLFAHFESDVDRDGDADSLGGDSWSENVELHRSALLLDERTVNSLVDEAYDVAVGDVDGDGDLDLVSAAEANDHVYWHRNDGTPGDDSSWNLSTLTSAVNGPRAVALGDLDRDGDLDAVVASYNDDSVSWLENDGTLAGWTKRVISAGAGGAHDVAVADLDGDGDLDVACAQYLDDEVSWYRNNGGSPPTFSAFFVDSLAYDGPIALAAGDLDGDGDLDLAVVAGTADTVVWYGNDGTPAVGEWSRHRTDNGEADGPRDVALADLDRDGDLDTLVGNYAGDDVLWYENDGTLAGWTARAINGTCGGARSVAPADFDGDGDLDVLAACFDDDALWLARNNGGSPPGFTSDLVTVGANGVRAVVAADLDRDGDLDGAAAQGFDDQIVWYENRGGQFRVLGTPIAGNPLINDAVQGVFRAVVTHRGRSGDGQLELAAMAVRLEEAPGDPLGALQAASLVDFVQVYGDDGDGLFEPEVDPLVAGVSPAGIDGNGTVWVDLPDGAAGVAVTALAQKNFFVALDLADPFLFAAPRSLSVTLLTDGASVCEAEDRDHDIPLDLEWRANVATATLAVLDVLFRDGFESGDTTRWSAVSP